MSMDVLLSSIYINQNVIELVVFVYNFIIFIKFVTGGIVAFSQVVLLMYTWLP